MKKCRVKGTFLFLPSGPWVKDKGWVEVNIRSSDSSSSIAQNDFYRSAEGWDHREATEEHGSQMNKYKIQQKFPADDTNNENKKQ